MSSKETTRPKGVSGLAVLITALAVIVVGYFFYQSVREPTPAYAAMRACGGGELAPAMDVVSWSLPSELSPRAQLKSRADFDRKMAMVQDIRTWSKHAKMNSCLRATYRLGLDDAERMLRQKLSSFELANQMKTSLPKQ